MKFISMMSFVFIPIFAAHAADSSDTLTYQCPSGPKSYETTINVACPNGSLGTRQCTNGIMANLKIGSQTLKPVISLKVGNQIIASGNGAFELEDTKLKLEQANELSRVSKSAPVRDGFVYLPAKLMVSSGPCKTEVDVTLKQYPDVIQRLETDLEHGNKKAIDEVKFEKQCKVELSNPGIGAAYANAHICILKKCDVDSAKKMADERASGKRSGFVNKLLLANLGHYQQLSATFQRSTSAFIRSKGKQVNCTTPISHDDYFFRASDQEEQVSCNGEVPIESVSKSQCFKALMIADGGVNDKTGKLKIIPILGTLEREINNAYKFVSDDAVQMAAQQLSNNNPQISSNKKIDTENLEPEQQAMLLDSKGEAEKHGSNPWKIIGGKYECVNMVGIVYESLRPGLDREIYIKKGIFNPAKIMEFRPGSNAQKKGLQVGDIVISIKGIPQPSTSQPNYEKGEVVPVVFTRRKNFSTREQGKPQTVNIQTIESCSE